MTGSLHYPLPMSYPPIYRSKAGYTAVMALYNTTLLQGPVPYETRFVPTRYGRTHVVVGGPVNGQPLVLFHGWNGSAAGIGGEFPFLFEHFRVYMPDIIGHAGRSEPNRPKTVGSTYADWAADVLDALDIPRALVLGVSGGGWMTLKLAAFYPQRVICAAVISTDGLSSANLWGIVRHMVPVAIRPNRTTMRWFMAFMTAPHTLMEEQAQAFGEGMLVVLRHFKSQENPGMLPDKELGQIASPLLVLMGEYERVFRRDRALERAQKLVPGLVSAEIVAHAGHLMTLEQPEWLKLRLLSFLRDGL